MSLRLLFVCSTLCAAVLSSAPIPQHLLNEWSQFGADDEFYDEMNSFLETGTTTTGGDFEFKCETTCQLVSTAAASGHASRANHAASFLQTEEGVEAKKAQQEADVSKQVEDAFYDKMDSFLETEAKTEAKTQGGDFEFKCETTCQLVQAAGNAHASASHAAANNAAANALLQTDSGLQAPRIERPAPEMGLQNNLELEAQSKASTEAAKDCYRLCLNPSMNPGCDTAQSVVSLLEVGSTTYEDLAGEKVAENKGNKNWSLGNGSGNCLNNCVHVCMAVHDPSTN